MKHFACNISMSYIGAVLHSSLTAAMTRTEKHTGDSGQSCSAACFPLLFCIWCVRLIASKCRVGVWVEVVRWLINAGGVVSCFSQLTDIRDHAEASVGRDYESC